MSEEKNYWKIITCSRSRSITAFTSSWQSSVVRDKLINRCLLNGLNISHGLRIIDGDWPACLLVTLDGRRCCPRSTAGKVPPLPEASVPSFARRSSRRQVRQVIRSARRDRNEYRRRDGYGRLQIVITPARRIKVSSKVNVSLAIGISLANFALEGTFATYYVPRIDSDARWAEKNEEERYRANN